MSRLRRIIGYIAYEFGGRCLEPVGEIQHNGETVMLLCDLPPNHYGHHSASMTGPVRRLTDTEDEDE